MKSGLGILRLLLVLCSTFATTVVLGQTAYTWTGAADGTNFHTTGNWSSGGPFGYPEGCIGDTALWDGVTTSDLLVSYTPGPIVEFCTLGMNLVLTANQTNSVTIISPVAQSGSLYLFGITNNSPSAPLILGDGGANILNVSARPAGAVHYWVNNSAAPVTINQSVRLHAGGGAAFTLDFDGWGDWMANNYLRSDNFGGATAIQKDGPGTMTWTAAGVVGLRSIGPITINGGTLVLKSSGLLANQPITNNAALQYDAAAQSQTLDGVISGTGRLKVRNGTLTLAGNNTYSGGTEIAGDPELGDNGTLQVGDGGTSGSIGSGDVTDNGGLVFNRSDKLTLGNDISGVGSVVQSGSGTLALTGANTCTGTTTVNNGILVVSSVGGDMIVSGGILAPASIGSIGTLNVAGNMTISSGAVLVTLNKSLSPSNSLFSVAGGINNADGTLKLLNFGPSLAVGDKFILFNQAVTGGAGMTILSPGLAVANDLEVDGSVTVTAVAPPGTCIITAVVSGGGLNLSWPAAFIGLHLQVQTNPLTIGLSNNWVTISGTDAGNGYLTSLNNTNVSVFYRLAP